MDSLCDPTFINQLLEARFNNWEIAFFEFLISIVISFGENYVVPSGCEDSCGGDADVARTNHTDL